MICHVFKRKRRIGAEVVESRDWFGALRMPWEVGLPRKWSLETTDKREAQRRLQEAHDKAEKRHHGLLPSETVEEARERPLNELLDDFLAHLQVIGRTAGTLKKYRNMRGMFARCGWLRIGHVTSRSFEEWRTRSPLSGKTLNDFLRNMGNFFHWMRRCRMVNDNPLEFVYPIKLTPKHYRRALTPDEVKRLLAVAPHGRAVIYLLAIQHGLRRKEIAGLTLGDFIFDTPAPFVRVPASLSKNRTEATLVLRPEVVAAIRSVLPPSPAVRDKLFPTVPRVRTLRKDCEAAGIPFVDAQGRRVDLHALRVTLGSNLFASGASLVVVKELMRHSDIKTTLKHYSDVSQLPLAAAVANLPAFVLPGALAAPAAPAPGERTNPFQPHGTQTGTPPGVSGSPCELQAVAGGAQ